MGAWNNAALPQPKRDSSTLKADLEEFGYCVIADALPRDALAAVRDRLLEQAAAERAQSIDHKNPAHADPVNQWINMLLNKGDVFRLLVTHPVTTELIAHLLGPGYLLSCLDAQVTHPGGETMPLHTDQWWMPPPVAPDANHPRASAITRGAGTALDPARRPAAISPPVVTNVMWLITDFTEENGATRLVPRSHLSGAEPDPSVPHKIPSVAATGPAGTAVVLDGRLWHAAGANTSNEARYGITANYCAPQCRPLENYTRGLRPEVMERMAPELLARLGFSAWSSYGHTGDPDAACALAGERVMGELRPENE